jgi:ethanolamine utilization protein EutL
MILEPLVPTLLSVRTIARAPEALLRAYGADPEIHTSLGLLTCDQDDSLYVALDEATKHAAVDVVFAKSFYGGAAHASGALSGEILGVLAAADPDEVEAGLVATRRCLEHDACFYAANADASIALFPHVIASLGHYLSSQAGLAPGEAMAYLVAPPMEAALGLEAALKAADVRAAAIVPPPSETNYASAWLTGDLPSCEAAAEAFAEAVVNVALFPFGE